MDRVQQSRVESLSAEKRFPAFTSKIIYDPPKKLKLVVWFSSSRQRKFPFFLMWKKGTHHRPQSHWYIGSSWAWSKSGSVKKCNSRCYQWPNLVWANPDLCGFCYCESVPYLIYQNTNRLEQKEDNMKL